MAGTSVIKTSILGALPSGEVWSVNPAFHLDLEGSDITAAEVLAIANAINAITVPTSVRTMMNNTTTITGVRVEARDREGALNALAEATRAAPVTGNGTSPHPYQTSWVTSLRTGFPGGQGRGRLYWPATGQAIDSNTLRVSAVNATSALSGVKTYIAAIQAAVAASAGPVGFVVWSRTGTAFHAVTSMRQGDVLDSQRRRRDALTEAYQELVYP